MPVPVYFIYIDCGRVCVALFFFADKINNAIMYERIDVDRVSLCKRQPTVLLFPIPKPKHTHTQTLTSNTAMSVAFYLLKLETISVDDKNVHGSRNCRHFQNA